MRTAPAAAALRIAIVGAESTGKTSLARALADRLRRDTGLRVTWVPEWLRDWCEHTGRTPAPHEQGAILRTQHEQIEAAAATHDVVLCDTTALMTAVYSRFLFDDRSLDERAAALQRRMALTLLTAIDLPWVPDGLQRDGPHVQGPIDTMLRELLIGHGLPWALVGGHGPARVQCAIDAITPLLRQRPAAASAPAGVFTRLGRPAAGAPAMRTWQCECCADPAGERAELRARRDGQR
jgi:nicotinamide riboside kinase